MLRQVYLRMRNVQKNSYTVKEPILSQDQELQRSAAEHERLTKAMKNQILTWIRRHWAVLLFGFLIVYGAGHLIVYLADYGRWVRTSRELSSMYSTEAPAQTPAPSRAVLMETMIQEDPEELAADLWETPVETTLPEHLPEVRYATEEISSRFQSLQSANPNVIGWLNMEGLLDQPVVQTSDDFYLTHDFYGRKNDNGTLLLDALVSMKTRPYSLVIYGHNMKSGAMFGCLRNYENRDFLARNPFLSFDSLYESARYVVLSVSRVSLNTMDPDYLDFYMLQSDLTRERRQCLSILEENAVQRTGVDVREDDQLLLLVTCLDDPDKRRVLVARRVREGEDETALRALCSVHTAE